MCNQDKIRFYLPKPLSRNVPTCQFYRVLFIKHKTETTCINFLSVQTLKFIKRYFILASYVWPAASLRMCWILVILISFHSILVIVVSRIILLKFYFPNQRVYDMFNGLVICNFLFEFCWYMTIRGYSFIIALFWNLHGP